MFNIAYQALHSLFPVRISHLKFCSQESSPQIQAHWPVSVCPSTKPLNEKFSLPKMFSLILPKFHSLSSGSFVLNFQTPTKWSLTYRSLNQPLYWSKQSLGGGLEQDLPPLPSTYSVVISHFIFAVVTTIIWIMVIPFLQTKLHGYRDQKSFSSPLPFHGNV